MFSEKISAYASTRPKVERVIEKAWLSMPLVEEWGYNFPKENGESVRQSYYGPEYMRVLRKNLLKVGG